MIPVEFEEQNCVYDAHQEGILPLPAVKAEDGQVVSCWELSDEEILEVIRTRRVWVCTHTCGDNCLQPLALFGNRSDVFYENEEEE